MNSLQLGPTVRDVPPDTAVVPIRVTEGGGLRRVSEPIKFGVPFAIGTVREDVRWTCCNAAGEPHAVQTRALAHWPDGSIRWLSGCMLVSLESHESAQFLLSPDWRQVPDSRGPGVPDMRARTTSQNEPLLVDTGPRQFRFGPGTDLFSTHLHTGPAAGDSCQFYTGDATGRGEPAKVERARIVEIGPIRTTAVLTGRLRRRSLLQFSAEICFYAGLGLVRVELTVKNPGRAQHPGGYWDLGDPGSEYLSTAALRIHSGGGGLRSVEWIENPHDVVQTWEGRRFGIHQESSGGAQWNSRNHVDRRDQVPLRFQGYEIERDGVTTGGMRASPVVSLRSEHSSIACSLVRFWEKFPSAFVVEDGFVDALLWPQRTMSPHELQGGEHCTRVLWIRFSDGRDVEHPCRDLAWTHVPLSVRLDASIYARSGTVPFLPAGGSPRRELEGVLREAVEGSASFFNKREAIDEYGWRHFGDLWADHEEAHYDGPKPVISHYNNQYDALHGFLIQYLLSGDPRWWELAEPLAQHLVDIDIYHAQYDKSAYCGGLFWHTAHYHDAGMAAHRSMSRRMSQKKIPAPGGGPGNEHNYSSGLLLYYYLTGSASARDAVVGLAEWVLAMDDGRQHLLGLVSSSPTGLASATRDPGFHGPGRGAGNSINGLLDGWLVTGDARYLGKAEELMRRTIHPKEDISRHELLNAEDRWSYTVYLQVLVRFLETTRNEPRLTETRMYARESLLHYARWMLANERLYLDRPEELEYPTETWAAQDLRKGNVLLMAAGHAAELSEAEAFRKRGMEILDQAWNQLLSHPSHTATRPLVLVLQQGYLETYYRALVAGSQRTQEETDDRVQLGQPRPFVPQQQEIRGCRSPVGLGRMVARLFVPGRSWNLARRSWIANRIRRWKG